MSLARVRRELRYLHAAHGELIGAILYLERLGMHPDAEAVDRIRARVLERLDRCRCEAEGM